MPLINLFDSMKEKFMLMFHKRHTKTKSWQDKITPRTKKLLDHIISKRIFLKLTLGRNEESELHEGPYRSVISLQTKIVTYGQWAISGLPNKHATRTVGYNIVDIQDYCHEYYIVEAYLRVYDTCPSLKRN